MKRPELLAPAGSMDALIAAVNNGTDAVYLGSTRFGARPMPATLTSSSCVRRCVIVINTR